jgi:hypothetical protein
MAATGSRTYRIRSHFPEFVTGLLTDGLQVLLVPTTASRKAQLLFDSLGVLLDSKEDVGDVHQQENVVLTQQGIEASMRTGTIAVLRFSHPTLGIGIRKQPEWFDEFLADPKASEPDERYREQTHRQIREWEEEGRFVLTTWGKEYWMNSDGSVFAT